MLCVSSHSKSADIEKVKANFDPKYRHEDTQIKILVTTDILSEGINLHRSNTIINYDIPWNSIRILQRVGRVNRIGSKYDKINIYNFFPTAQSEREIGLEKLAVAKIQAFHDTLGEDTKYLTGEEEFNSWELFSLINSTKIFDEEDKDVESELTYLKEIRKIRDEEPDVFEKVKRLPIKARTARKDGDITNSLLTFFRKGSLKKFFIAKDNKSNEIDFFSAVKLIKVGKEEAKLSIPSNYHDLLNVNKNAFDASIKDETEEKLEKRGGGSEKTLMRTVKALLECKVLTEEDEDYLFTLIEALDEGAVNKKSINMVINSIKGIKDPLTIFSEIRNRIPDNYLANLGKFGGQKRGVAREIILSEAFI